MCKHIDIATENLQHILQRGIQDTNDLISLAATGERLRRTLVLLDSPNETADRALRDYDEALAAHADKAPDGLDDDLQAVLNELAAYADTPTWRREADEGETILLGLDEVLSVGAACFRARRLPREQLDHLGATARRRVDQLTPKLQDLWQFAEDQGLALGPDSDHPQLFGYWDELAELAPSRLRLAVATRDAARRARVIDDAVARFEDRQRATESGGLLKAIRDALAALPGLPVPLPQPVAVAAFAAEAGQQPEVKLVHQLGQLSVLQDGHTLSLQLPVGHVIRPLEVEASGDVAPQVEQTDDHLLRITFANLGPGALACTVRVTVDGEPLALPLTLEVGG